MTSTETEITVMAVDPAYDDEKQYKTDNTTCTITVSDGSDFGMSCGRVAFKKRCEFHYVLARDSAARRDCRISGSGLVSDSAKHRYAFLYRSLVQALKNDTQRSYRLIDNEEN